MARSFSSRGVTVVSTKNRGLSAAQNEAFCHCHGDYIQWLDSDDLLAPDKIERQLAALRPGDSNRVLLSSPWAYFYHRTRRARFVRNSLWQDLSPVEWLLRKLSENLHMQNATWLVSRELTEAAGPWNEGLNYDQDGEYFVRVLLSSAGTRFVPGTGIFYRATGSGSVSQIGNSYLKKESLLVSMKLQIQYIRSLEDSDRVRKVCVTYLQNWYCCFYPERPDLASQARALAAEMGGQLHRPQLSRKYAWLVPLLGWDRTRRVQLRIGPLKAFCVRGLDKLMLKLEGGTAESPTAPMSPAAVQ